jgi:hypothetical protein
MTIFRCFRPAPALVREAGQGGVAKFRVRKKNRQRELVGVVSSSADFSERYSSVV